MSRNSSVGIATHYVLDSPGSNPGGDKIFRNRPVRPCSHTPHYTRGTGTFLGIERQGRGLTIQRYLVPRLKKE